MLEITLVLTILTQYLQLLENFNEMLMYAYMISQGNITSAPLLPPPEAYASSQGIIRQLFRQVLEWNDQNQRRRRTCNDILEDENSLFIETHFTKIEFQALYDLVAKELNMCLYNNKISSRQRGFSPQEKLLLVLMWIRRYRTGNELGTIFGVSKSVVCKWLNKLIPLLCDKLAPEVQFPSSERINILKVSLFNEIKIKGTLPDFPNAIGSMDAIIHQIRLPGVNEERNFRGDKGIHFENTLTVVDFSGIFLFVEPGYGGRLQDREVYKSSELVDQLTSNNIDVLADRGFTNEIHCITPQGDKIQAQMKERAVQESTYHELRSSAAATTLKWRHKKCLHPATIKLSMEIFNFKKRRRLMNSLKLMEEASRHQYL